MSGIIYFDNAATIYPKPPSVVSAVTDAIKYSGGNPGRGSHVLSERASELVYDTRETAAMMFGAQPENVIFTVNATHALNYAIKGLARRRSHILIDNFAHNASYRPALALARSGFCSLEVYDASEDDDETVENILRKIRNEDTIVITTHQSNISSKILPIRKMGEVCAEAGCRFVVDAAQSAGHLSIDMRRDHITALCMPGHKGLYGIMGVGMLVSAPETRYNTLIEGGAGIASLEEKMPENLPERFEAGTLPLPAIASLKAGMEFVNSVGIDKIHAHEAKLARRFADGVSKTERLHLHGDCTGSVISLTADGIKPSVVGEYLSSRGICVRTGYHCAPLAHRTLGTIEDGTVRFGFSCFNTESEVDFALDSLRELCSTK